MASRAMQVGLVVALALALALGCVLGLHLALVVLDGPGDGPLGDALVDEVVLDLGDALADAPALALKLKDLVDRFLDVLLEGGEVAADLGYQRRRILRFFGHVSAPQGREVCLGGPGRPLHP